jgi:RIO-like serine/threonine protein kinase
MTDNPYYTKIIPYTDKVGQGKISLEVELQKVASKHGFCPQIYDHVYHPNECHITMGNLNAPCLADQYGDDIDDIPQKVWDQIVLILKILYYDEGIEYIDITPYNFIEKDGIVYIIDFGHAYYVHYSKETNWFLKDVLNGHKGWNPDFK